jgi:hypothetical protein
MKMAYSVVHKMKVATIEKVKLPNGKTEYRAWGDERFAYVSFAKQRDAVAHLQSVPWVWDHTI